MEVEISKEERQQMVEVDIVVYGCKQGLCWYKWSAVKSIECKKMEVDKSSVERQQMVEVDMCVYGCKRENKWNQAKQ